MAIVGQINLCVILKISLLAPVLLQLKPFHQTIFWLQIGWARHFPLTSAAFPGEGWLSVTTVCWIVWAPGCRAFTVAVAVEIIAAQHCFLQFSVFLWTGATPVINGIWGGSCSLTWIPFCIIGAHMQWYWDSMYSYSHECLIYLLRSLLLLSHNTDPF